MLPSAVETILTEYLNANPIQKARLTEEDRPRVLQRLRETETLAPILFARITPEERKEAEVYVENAKKALQYNDPIAIQAMTHKTAQWPPPRLYYYFMFIQLASDSSMFLNLDTWRWRLLELIIPLLINTRIRKKINLLQQNKLLIQDIKRAQKSSTKSLISKLPKTATFKEKVVALQRAGKQPRQLSTIPSTIGIHFSYINYTNHN